MELSEREAYIFGLLANGRTATSVRINNGHRNIGITERLLDAGLVIPSSTRAYVAAFVRGFTSALPLSA